VLPQNLLRTVGLAAYFAIEHLSDVAENRIGLVPLHVRLQSLSIGEDVCAEFALQLVVGETLLRLITSAVNVPQVIPQLCDVVEFVIAHLTLEIPQ
jgi:hypothetical protein